MILLLFYAKKRRPYPVRPLTFAALFQRGRRRKTPGGSENIHKQLAELTTAARLHAEGMNADRQNELAGTIIDGKRQLMDGGDQTESSTPPKIF